MAARLMLAAFALGLLTLASSLQVRFSAPFWQVRTGDFSAHYFLADQPSWLLALAEQCWRLFPAFLLSQVVPLLLLAGSVAALARSLPNSAAARPAPRSFAPGLWLLAVGLLLLGIQRWSLSDFPFSGDETSYLLQADLLASGRLKGPVPPGLSLFFQAPSVVCNQEMYSKYPVGWPCLLALAGLLGARSLLNPVLGCLTLGLLWRWSAQSHLPRSACNIGLAGMALSPFFLLNGASYSVHVSALLATVLALFASSQAGMGFRWLQAAGFFWLTLIRPIDLIFPLLIQLFLQFRQPRRWLATCLGVGLGGLAVMAVQWVQNGHPLLSGYSVYDPEDRWGWGAHGHGPLHTLWNQLYCWMRWQSWLPAGWTVFALLGWGCCPRWLRLACLAALAQLAFYAGYFSLGIVEYGPRYWFIPTLVFHALAGLGVWQLLRTLECRWPGRAWLRALLGVGLVHTLASTLGVASACRQEVGQPAHRVQQLVEGLERFGPCLMLVQSGNGMDPPSWVRLNRPDFKQPVLFAHFLSPEENARLAQSFPGRSLGVLRQEVSADGRTMWRTLSYPRSVEPLSGWLAAGETYLLLRRSEEARRCFEQLLQLQPDHPQALGYLGHLDFEQQKFQSAASFYRQSLLGGPSPSVRYGLARCLLKLGQVEEARRQFQLLAREAVGPESQRARSWLQVHRP